jgi:hypothetical protein
MEVGGLECGAGPGAPASALYTLLAQIDARWPLRKRRTLDGMESYKALRLTEDERVNGPARLGPNIVALSFVLRADPRVEKTEILKPGGMSSLSPTCGSSPGPARRRRTRARGICRRSVPR